MALIAPYDDGQMKVRWWFAVGHGAQLQRETEDGWQVSPTSKADKGPFYTKDFPPPFFLLFFLLNLQILGLFVPASSPLSTLCQVLTPED